MTTILVLDDREADRELLSTVLRYAQYSVLEAARGEEALALARADPPDLIMADILMPEMNGYEFVRRLRADDGVGNVPVVFCTATYEQDEVRALAEACGVSHVMVKPCEPEEIVRIVGEVLGATRQFPPRLAHAQFDREQLRILNEKLVEMVHELETAGHAQRQLEERLRRAERRSAESLALLEAIQGAAPVALAFVDWQLRLVHANTTFSLTRGVPLEEILGRSLAEVIPEVWEQVGPAYHQVLRSGEPVLDKERRRVDENGELRFYLASYFPVRIDNELLGVGAVALDITARKLAEEAIQRQHEQIVQLAEDRRRLMAEALDAEDRTRARIAQALHDEVLQELLAARQDVSEARNGTGPVQDLLEQAHEGLVRSIGWLRDATLDLHPVSLEHGGLSAALCAIAERVARRGGFTCTVDTHPAAEGHRDELIVALVRELLTNAAKHAQATRVAIEIRPEGEGITVEVTDNGLGMAPERHRVAVEEGHIGLASTRQRVEAIGGSFDLSSAPGAGTTVRLDLPTRNNGSAVGAGKT